MIDVKEFEEMFFNEFDGVDIRFRNGQYGLKENEREMIRSYIDDTASRLKNDGVLSKEDIKNILYVIIALNKSPEDDATKLLHSIFVKLSKA